jgi:hypothetical protein
VTEEGQSAVYEQTPIAEPWASCPEATYRGEFLRAYLEELREWRAREQHRSSHDQTRTAQLRSHLNREMADGRRFVREAGVVVGDKAFDDALRRTDALEPLADVLERAISFYEKHPDFAVPDQRIARSPPTASGRYRSGQVVGGWEIVREAGHGGNALVYQAHRNGQDGALKQLYRRTEESEGRFHREVAALKALPEHPHLVRILDVAPPNADDLWYVMTWVDGPTLHDDRARYAGELVHRRRDAIKHSAVALDDRVRGLGPGKWCRALVPTPHVGCEVFA